MKKRILSLCLVFCMVFTVFSLMQNNRFYAESGGQEQQEDPSRPEEKAWGPSDETYAPGIMVRMKTISVEDCLTPDVSWGDCLAEIPYLYYVRDMNVFNRHLIMTMAGKLTLEDFLTRYPNHTEESYYYYVKNYYKTSYEPLLIFGLEEGYRYKDYIEYCIELIEQWEGVDYAIPILEWQAVPASGKTFEDYDALFEGKEYAMDRLIVVFGSGVSKGNVSVDYILNTSYDYPGTQFCDSVTDLTADLFELVRIQSRYKTKESYLEKGGSEEKWEKAQAVDLTNYRRILVYHLKEEYQNRETLQEIIYRIGNQPARFELALPDYEWKVQMASVPTDPYYPDQAAAFGLIDLPQAWPVAAAETASSVKVAVMDSGIDYLHPDLAGRVDTSLSYDFSDPLNVRPDPYPSDSFGHGTRVACVLGAVTNNSIGMAGACPNVELVSYKVLHEDENGQQRCWATSFAAALAQCTSDEIPIANLSWGFDIASENKTETQLLWEFLVNDGVLTVHAAGNGILNNEAGTDLDSIEDYIGPGTAFVDLTSREYVPLYPSLLPGPVDNLISVGACTLTDEPADFSNYGASSVDLFAPGEDIVTSAGNGYSADSYGTSFAAPFVTAAAAMLKAMNPALTSAQIKQILLSTADTDAAYSGKCTSGGRLNVLNAVLTQHTHTHTYQNLGVLNGHMERCTECGISCTEAHSWTNFGLQFRCYKCGVVSAGIPVDLNVVGIQPEETVFASLKRRTFFGLA